MTAHRMLCPHCREPVDVDATYCPHCRKRVRGVALGQVVGALLVLLVAAVIVAAVVASWRI